MFAQIIQGRTSDAEAVRTALDRWMEELQPGATGWLGSTVGVSDDGRFVAVARFESAEAAGRNSERPEQSRWWEETQRFFDGEVTFADSEDVDVDLPGDPDSAGFVQVMQGRVTDRERARELIARLSTKEMADFRPDILGTVMINHGTDRWSQVIYFTSEAEAREGERTEAPPEVQGVMEELMALTPEPPEFIDLRQPLLYAPPATGAGVPTPREAPEAARAVERSS
ncbi:hypothetical protein [Trujillonella endophytica]|uniref:Antibiotic biosynthesis monooxygenase n=1 Tax=Trujillonella endophytica TaxID=673521 RepID=A0A1H8PAD2_9ACTN|nr:hypothetical protein [Trujillella endophytica]SEO38875.1 hypothetical protein SAMN05660991_00062 [Trujillella endophytica]